MNMMRAPHRSFQRSLYGAKTQCQVDRTEFVGAMSGGVTGVNVVTTAGDAGLYGITVSAVASVSADPPMVMACINRNSPAATAIRHNGVFCVNLLAAHHSDISDTFAGRPGTGEPFDFGRAEWLATPTGSMRLPDAAASFDCLLHAAHDAGTHTIFIGKVISTATSDHEPLAYCRRTYCVTSPNGGAQVPARVNDSARDSSGRTGS